VSFSPQVWDQIRNVTADELIKALEKDGYEREPSQGAILVYRQAGSGNRVTVHYHPKKTFGPKLLKDLLADIGWTDADLRRLKLVK
jgi:predicted RNA binding protein YcfA (HicA-like mRNA interferase family)